LGEEESGSLRDYEKIKTEAGPERTGGMNETKNKKESKVTPDATRANQANGGKT